VTYDGRNAYLYDPEGRRVAKGTGASLSCGAPTAANGFTLGSQYLLDQSGNQASELGPTGNAVHSNVWEGGRLTGTYDSTGLHFAIADPLGTKRVQAVISSTGTGVPELNCLSLPFGNNIGNTLLSDCVAVGIGGTDATEHHFTGKERDAESGNDYFGARYYASSMGRWLSPDWSAKVMPVPYAKLDDPQSLNLYAYVRNNPLTRVDPDGHCGGYNPATGQMYCPSDDLKHPVWASVPQKFKLPNGPSGLGPEWTQDTGHKNPNGSKWKNPDGWDLEFHKGRQGAKGFRGKDHWHLTPPGAEEKDDEHLAPGTEVTVTVPDPKPKPAAEPEDSRSAMDKVNDWLNDHLPQGVKDYLRDHPYGPNSSPGPGPVYSPPPIWAEPW